jgi:hypothetical protein
MKSSEARFLMEKHLSDFLAVFPEDIPNGYPDYGSPIFRMGMAGGLSVESAARYVYWLIHTKRITDREGGGLASLVGDTARFVCQIPHDQEATWQQLGINWDEIEKSVHEKPVHENTVVHYGIVVRDDKDNTRYTTIMCRADTPSTQLSEGRYSTKIVDVTCAACKEKHDFFNSDDWKNNKEKYKAIYADLQSRGIAP